MLDINKSTTVKLISLFEVFGYDKPFTRSDVINICKLAPSSAGKLLTKVVQLKVINSIGKPTKRTYYFKKQN